MRELPEYVLHTNIEFPRGILDTKYYIDNNDNNNHNNNSHHTVKIKSEFI